MRLLLISGVTKMCISFVILADPRVLVSVRGLLATGESFQGNFQAKKRRVYAYAYMYAIRVYDV